MLRTIAVSLLLVTPVLAAGPAVQQGLDDGKPHASQAWIRAAAVPGRPAAGYLTVNGGRQPDTIVSVTSPGHRIEMHSMTMEGGVMRMAKLDVLPVPAAARVAFANGGNHLMIFGMTSAPKTLPLTLNFGSGAKLTTIAQVQAPGAAAPVVSHVGHGQR